MSTGAWVAFNATLAVVVAVFAVVGGLHGAWLGFGLLVFASVCFALSAAVALIEDRQRGEAK